MAYRISRLDNQLDEKEREEIEKVSGISIPQMINKILDGIDTDKQIDYAREKFQTRDPTPQQIADAAKESIRSACSLFDSPELRIAIMNAKNGTMVIGITSIDALVRAGFNEQAGGSV